MCNSFKVYMTNFIFLYKDFIFFNDLFLLFMCMGGEEYVNSHRGQKKASNLWSEMDL